mgnify:CR=1 FL=1
MPRRRYSSRLRRRQQSGAKRSIGFVVFVVLVLGIVAAGYYWRLSQSSTKSSKNQQVEKSKATDQKAALPVAATTSGSESILEKVVEKVTGKVEPQTPADLFTRWAVLDNFEGGYHLVYPNEFKINYSAASVELTPPSGPGKVIVSIASGSYNVTVDLAGASSDEQKLLNAAANLVRNSFKFISGPGYDAGESEKRFGS